MRIVTITFVVVCTVIGIWFLMYPSASDSKNIRYVFWKAGLYRMDLDLATGAMIGDANRDNLVIGKTKQQLRSKFGDLTSASDATPYLQGCYQNSSWKNNDVLFIRKGPWMVVFNGERATNLVLLKGC